MFSSIIRLSMPVKLRVTSARSTGFSSGLLCLLKRSSCLMSSRPFEDASMIGPVRSPVTGSSPETFLSISV